MKEYCSKRMLPCPDKCGQQVSRLTGSWTDLLVDHAWTDLLVDQGIATDCLSGRERVLTKWV